MLLVFRHLGTLQYHLLYLHFRLQAYGSLELRCSQSANATSYPSIFALLRHFADKNHQKQHLLGKCLSTTSMKLRHGAKGARKVKSGCRTCKHRHKKCDEAKPSCSQCVSAKWTCDFVSSPTQLYQRPCINLHESDVQHLNYFKTVCTREFVLYFEDSLWEVIILQAALTEPCIQHATLALSSLSRSRYYVDEYQHATFEYSTKHYNLAIQALRVLLESPQNCEIAVLASIVFIVIEMLQKHDNRVVMLLQSSSKLLKDTTYQLNYLRLAVAQIGSQLRGFDLYHGGTSLVPA